MTVVIFYPLTAKNESRTTVSNPENAQEFSLCWSNMPIKINPNPLTTTHIPCGHSEISFSHLKAPFLFISESVNYSDQLLTNLENSGKNCLLLKNNQGIDNITAGNLCGIFLTEDPGKINSSTHSNFIDWLCEKANNLKNSNNCEMHETTSEAYQTSTADVSVIIPLYNGLDYTKALWESLINVKTNLRIEYIFVDNGSTDASPLWLKSIESSALIILNDQNRNFAGACNQGAEAASSELLIFLNNDTLVTDYWADSLIEPLKKDPHVGMVGNLQIFPGTSLVHHAGIYFDQQKHPKHYLEGCRTEDPRVNFERVCQSVTAACMAMHKKDFQALEGFFSGYKNGYEDVDLCIRLLNTGKKILYTPESKIYHYVSKSPGRGAHNQANFQLYHQRCKEFISPDLKKFIAQNSSHGC